MLVTNILRNEFFFVVVSLWSPRFSDCSVAKFGFRWIDSGVRGKESKVVMRL